MRPRRQLQAAEVKKIVTARFGADAGSQPFVVLGDLNDYLETNQEGEPGITELAGWDQIVNVVERLPADQQWTHFWAGGNEYRQLDYLLLSTSLAQVNAEPPEIVRKGLPLRATRYTGERFPGVGQDRPKASDHCPTIMELALP